MTTTTPPARVGSALPLTVTVAVTGDAVELLDELRDMLGAVAATGVIWQVEAAGQAALDPQLALAGGVAAVRAAAQRWPGVAVIGLVPLADNGAASLAALDAGAMVCVRGADPGLVAAYVRSVARRRGLLGLVPTT